MTEKKESILSKIIAQREKDVSQLQESIPLSSLKAQLPSAPPIVSFPTRLLSSPPMAVIGEIKRASPSKGPIDLAADAPNQALLYALGGAAAISVLTEPTWFKGTIADLQQVRQAIDHLGEARPAVLRKDFIIDPYQVYEARVAGADTLLLIVAVLEDERLTSLLDLSRELGMEPLVEVNNDEEMRRAVRLGAKVIGVNNRNLHTFSVDMATTSNLASLVPDDVILAALSGITGREDVVQYEKAKARAVLVGEALMRSEDKKAFIRGLLGQE